MRLWLDQTGSDSRKLHVSLAGPNPEHMDDELTKAEEEVVAREVHATHARIVSGPDPEPMQEGPSTGSNQGRSAKRRRLESAASGSAQPPSK
ncbi:hypothetical protein Tco_0147547, partial [Tanacetum coccineum]